MNSQKTRNILFLPAYLVLAVAIGSGVTAQAADAPEGAPQAVADVAPEAAPDASAEALMNTPLDGSSIEAFEAGLAAVKAGVSPKDYQALTNSLQWLQFYDISARGKRDKLYRNLDGKSPQEIIDRVKANSSK